LQLEHPQQNHRSTAQSQVLHQWPVASQAQWGQMPRGHRRHWCEEIGGAWKSPLQWPTGTLCADPRSLHVALQIRSSGGYRLPRVEAEDIDDIQEMGGPEVLLGSWVAQGPWRECSRQSRAIGHVSSSSVGFRHQSSKTEDGHTGSRLTRRIVYPAAYRRRRTGQALSASAGSPVPAVAGDAVSCLEGTVNA